MKVDYPIFSIEGNKLAFEVKELTERLQELECRVRQMERIHQDVIKLEKRLESH